MIHVHVMKTYGDSTASPRHFRSRFNEKDHSFVSHARWYVQIDGGKPSFAARTNTNWKVLREIHDKRNKSTRDPVALLKNLNLKITIMSGNSEE